MDRRTKDRQQTENAQINGAQLNYISNSVCRSLHIECGAPHIRVYDQ